MSIIYVDADACPVKEEVIRVATRYGLRVYLVSNQGLRVPRGADVHSIMVSDAFDAADDWIAERCEMGDIVITADIRLAARVIAKGAKALGPTGRVFNTDNIGSVLAMRELNAYLREAGEIKEHNASFSKQDRSKFLQSFDTVIQQTKH